MSEAFMSVGVNSNEIAEKLNKLADFADTLGLKIKASYTIDFECDWVTEVHIDVVPVKYTEG